MGRTRPHETASRFWSRRVAKTSSQGFVESLCTIVVEHDLAGHSSVQIGSTDRGFSMLSRLLDFTRSRHRDFLHARKGSLAECFCCCSFFGFIRVCWQPSLSALVGHLPSFLKLGVNGVAQTGSERKQDLAGAVLDGSNDALRCADLPTRSAATARPNFATTQPACAESGWER